MAVDENVTTIATLPALSVTKAGTSYTQSTPFDRAVGYVAVRVASTAGSITVTQQCSIDDTTFYDPVDSSNGALGAIAATMTVGTRYVQYDPVLCPYIRFKVVEGNVEASTVTITLLVQK